MNDLHCRPPQTLVYPLLRQHSQWDQWRIPRRTAWHSNRSCKMTRIRCSINKRNMCDEGKSKILSWAVGLFMSCDWIFLQNIFSCRHLPWPIFRRPLHCVKSVPTVKILRSSPKVSNKYRSSLKIVSKTPQVSTARDTQPKRDVPAVSSNDP